MAIPKKYLSKEGVTLLEVMVALAVTSIALVSFISLVLTSLEMEDYARKMTEAMMVADERMKEIERTEVPEVGEREGLINEDDPTGFTYKETVTETIIENVRFVELEIYWDNRKRSVTLSAYMLQK
jgi:general secretion pathway protein I